MMKMNRTLLIGSVVLAVGVGFASAQDKSAGATPPAAAAPVVAKLPVSKSSGGAVADYPVIGHIEKRGRTITIKSGPKGSLYSVKTAEGKVLFENVSAEQLRAQAPELHEFIKTAVAGNGAKSGAVVDASVRQDGRR